MVDVLKCTDRKREEQTVEEKVEAIDKPVARTQAALKAEETALKEALAILDDVECPEDCPHIRVYVDLDKPVSKGCMAANVGRGAGQPGFECTATCTWHRRLGCTKEALPVVPAKPITTQTLLCAEDEIARYARTASGTETGATQAEAEAAARQALMFELRKELARIVGSVQCSHRCPDKRLKILLGPALPPACQGPDADGKWTCTLKRDWTIRIHCTT